MKNYISFENAVFDSLDQYVEDVYDMFKAKKKDSPSLAKNLIKIREENGFSVFFLCSEVLLELLQGVGSTEEFSSIREEGFFILTPVKTTLAIGRGYEISYCKNSARIISKNLVNYGYVYITETNSLTRVEDTLLLCKVQEADVDERAKGSRRLVELFPGLYIFFNSSTNRQALILNIEN